WSGTEWRCWETRDQESEFTAEEIVHAQVTGDKRREIARQRRSDSHSRLFHFRTTGARGNSRRRQFRLDRSPPAITGRAGSKLIHSGAIGTAIRKPSGKLTLPQQPPNPAQL